MPRLTPTPVKESTLYKNECVRLKDKISPRQLLIELNKVWRSGQHMHLVDYKMDKVRVSNSFLFKESPQGFDFWNKII